MASARARRRNVLGAFKVADPHLIAGKRILLLDDVLDHRRYGASLLPGLETGRRQPCQCAGPGPRCEGVRHAYIGNPARSRVCAAMKPVRIYTTPICPYCVRAKSLLKKKGVEVEEVDVFMDMDARSEMEAKTGGARTVPQIFIGDTHVGGCDELYALEKEGKLDPLLTCPLRSAGADLAHISCPAAGQSARAPGRCGQTAPKTGRDHP